MIDINRIKIDAEKGIDTAIVKLGFCYLKGKGVQKNRVEAVNLFRKAALLNNCNGMYNLAMCLLRGQGCDQNEAEALDVLQKAAELKHIDSINFLGSHFNRIGNIEKAKEYYKIAAELNDPYGMHMLAALYMRDPEKRYEAKKMFYENYIILNNDPKEFISTLECYEISNLEKLVTKTSDPDYLRSNVVCSLLTIPSFSTQFIWEIVKEEEILRVKQTVWNKKVDEHKIRSILKNDIEYKDTSLISKPFTIQPTIESIYLNTDSSVLQEIVDRLKGISLPLNLIQDYIVINDGIINKFKMGLGTTIKIEWNVHLPKAWGEFEELLTLMKAEIHKDPKAIR